MIVKLISLFLSIYLLGVTHLHACTSFGVFIPFPFGLWSFYLFLAERRIWPLQILSGRRLLYTSCYFLFPFGWVKGPKVIRLNDKEPVYFRWCIFQTCHSGLRYSVFLSDICMNAFLSLVGIITLDVFIGFFTSVYIKKHLFYYIYIYIYIAHSVIIKPD